MADGDRMTTTDSDTEGQGDKFEDAPDTTPRPPAPPSPKSPQDMPTSVIEGGPSSATSTPRGSRIISQMDIIVPKPNDEVTNAEEIAASINTIPKSPLLTAHSPSTSSSDHPRLDSPADNTSTTSSADIHNLDEREPEAITSALHTKPPPKTRGLSANLPSMPWGPSPAPKAKDSTSTSAEPAPKKLGMSFSWLSRGRTGNKDPPATATDGPSSRSPSTKERRDTVTSVNSISSNTELMIKKFEESNSPGISGTALDPRKKQQQDTLRERFKLLRMREEASMRFGDDHEPLSPASSSGALAALIGRGASVGLGIGSPTSIADEKERGLVVSSPITAAPPAIAATTTSASLAPGTASGVSAGPSAMADPAAPVDWDLWQSVVYEGPSAVARTSAEELSRAITSGIPSAIRGVVWQVLAQSKNEELEIVYKELVVRGTDKDREHQAALNGQLPQPAILNGNTREKQSVASSASSIHSDHSTAASTAINGLSSPSPSMEKDHESILKQQTAMVAERKQKAKEDAATLSKLEKVIKRDLGARTSYSKYAAAAGLQEGLFGVCKAYALFDEGVGYAQGMNFLVMPLLFNMPEEEAFCLLVRMMNQYHLREMFIQDMPGLHLHLYQFARLLEDLEPALYCHLHRRNVDPQLYATQWFLTLFAYRLPLQLVLRIYDLILSEGLEGAILKFGIVLMQKNAETLLGMNDMLTLTTFLKERLFDVYIDQAPSSNSLLDSGFFGSAGGIDKEVYRADLLVQDACAVKIMPQSLKTYTSEWEEKQRGEKDREAELETLRTSNASLMFKVRSLEQRTEKSDAEHVEMASELVRTKVENQELMDSVESLKGQSEELRTLIERQPEEVEQRLKAEMDRIMQRNVEVQNENRGLEEQMAEMEKELVQTKMSYAEINAEHESLKQKWLELRKAIGT